ncbi:uncharacterized protein CTRU02_211906 [Colletotrichum truncatum]|uniref:Uncharacterized protein n=1 Tax=Colletotrichum truncatum TaxID=5467 RepID=A0ACC3YM08_COLTU|nr:uncharacterized protein CTRU02_07315 [Colletotrichum truncatum]KAF6791553.1 hypothetical protein CTRU02_07315 [Colletotrichum truncatum]
MRASNVAMSAKRKASTDSEADDMPSLGQLAKPRKRVPAEIWETKRPTITRLYQEEKRSLKEVMEIMERDYHFVATVKMYKSRIWKWGLDKKLKGDEVLAIMLLKRDRDALKKPTEFRIRGQLVDMDNINRYLKRNPSLMAKFKAGQTPSVQTAIEVTCRTPSPPPSPPRALAPTTEMQSTEQVLCLFRDYIDGSFSSGVWWCEYDVECSNRRLDQEDRSNDLFERVVASFALVNRCMIRGDQIDINRVLGPAFESLKGLVASETPNFVARTVCLLWYLERHYKHDLLRLVLDYLAGLIPIVLGSNHILAHIWRRLGATEFSSYYELSMRLYALLLPEIEDRVGPANYLTHLLYSDYLDCMLGQQDPEDCEAMLSRHIARAEASGQEHPWLGDMALSHAGLLATCKENQGRLDEAVEVLTSHMNAYSMTDDQEAALNLELGVKYYRMGNIPAAITSFKSAARIALTSDVDERTSNAALANLENALRKMGNIVKADRVHQYRMDRVAMFAEKSASMSKGFSDDYDDDSDDVSIELEALPEWLWKCNDGEEETPQWLELPVFAWGEKSSPTSFAGCPSSTLEWANTSQSGSPAVLSAGYSPPLDNHVIDPEVEYLYAHEGSIQ